MNARRISLGVLAAVILFSAGWQVGVTSASTPSTTPIAAQSQALTNTERMQAGAPYGIGLEAQCNGTPVVCVPLYLWTPTPIPSIPSPSATANPTATRTPIPPTASRTPAMSATPLEVTPLGTPGYPRYVKAEREYIPLARLLIRRAPLKADNWTGAYALADQRYTIWHLREYADGSVWGCLDDVAPTLCARWFAIRADLAPVDGVLETYAKEAPELDG